MIRRRVRRLPFRPYTPRIRVHVVSVVFDIDPAGFRRVLADLRRKFGGEPPTGAAS